jgi:hypothetical protein
VSAAVALRVVVAVGLWVGALLIVDAQGPVPQPDPAGYTVAGEVESPETGPEPRQAEITNQHAVPLAVTAASGTVRDASARCPASLVAFRSTDATVEVPPGETASVPGELQVEREAPADCRAAAWSVEFAATAIEPASTATSASDDGGPGLLAYVGATAGVLLLAGAVLLTIALVRPRRDPDPPPGHDHPPGRARGLRPRRSVATAARPSTPADPAGRCRTR